MSRNRVREFSSSEESYASAVQPLSTSATSPISSKDGRSRRTRGCSSNNDPIVEGFLNEDFRAGGPRLAALPCNTLPVNMDHPAAIIWRTDRSFIDSILQVVRNREIDAKSVDLLGRQTMRKYLKDTGIVNTIIVSARKGDIADSSWLLASFDIRDILTGRNLSSVNVEIIDSRASIEMLSSPILSNDSIFPHWDRITSEILQYIGRDGWLSLECFRWGPNDILMDPIQTNPITIILTVPYDTEKDWKPTREAIISILHHLDLCDVAVSIIRGYVWKGNTPSPVVLPDNSWLGSAQCGMSIGLNSSTYSASTFGATIEIQLPNSQSWLPMGLTCFNSAIHDKDDQHMSIEEKTCLRNWKEKGILAADQNAINLKFDQPSLRDHTYRMDMLNSSIMEFENDPKIRQYRTDIAQGNFVLPNHQKHFERQIKQNKYNMELRDKAQKFFASGKAYLGHVFSASGYRLTSDNPPSQLDWCLIQVKESRLAANKIPPVGTYENPRYAFDGSPMSAPQQEAIQPGQLLFKLGRTTSFTDGAYNGLYSVLLESGHFDGNGKPIKKETYEHAVTNSSEERLFSKSGDSGAAIFNVVGEFMGLLFAGNTDTRATYFTHWRTLFEDIKKITKATAVRIPN